MRPPALAKILKGDEAPPEEEPAADDGEEQDMGSAKVDAAQAALDAFGAKDAKGLSEALSAHYDLCSGGDK